MHTSSSALMRAPVDSQLPATTVTHLAQRTGFIRRTRKITAPAFLQACCLIATAPCASLRTWAVILGSVLQETLSKQALAKRFTPACVQFLRQSLFAALKQTSRLQPQIDTGTFQRFRRVLLQDSTSLALPRRLAAIFPGSGNQHQATTATLKIQTVYDALSERFLHFRLTPFRRNDQTASRDLLPLIQAGDLVLRDLGYFVLDVFAGIAQRRAFFLSRYQHGTCLTRPDGRPFDLLRALRQHGTLDIDLCVGRKALLPVRLVALPVPHAVAGARRRKLRHNRNRKVNPSADHLALLEWEIFITNVPPDTWTATTVGTVYGIRWRIEIIFKTWKQHCALPQFTEGNRFQIESLIYAKLLFITLFQVYIFRAWNRQVQHRTGRPLSLLKVAQFVAHQLWLIIWVLSQPKGAALLEAQIMAHCTYERRKRLNYQDMLAVLT
jgi:hypothetical protein